jgi:hypothetical protein
MDGTSDSYRESLELRDIVGDAYDLYCRRSSHVYMCIKPMQYDFRRSPSESDIYVDVLSATCVSFSRSLLQAMTLLCSQKGFQAFPACVSASIQDWTLKAYCQNDAGYSTLDLNHCLSYNGAGNLKYDPSL